MGLKYSSKINKIRTVALGLIFAGMIIMYIGLYFRNIEWLLVTLMILGLIAIGLSTVIYLWIGMLSTKAIPIECPECGKPTKMLGRVDACMHCQSSLSHSTATLKVKNLMKSIIPKSIGKNNKTNNNFIHIYYVHM